MLVSAVWIGPAILGAIDGIAQHYIWGEPGPVDAGRVLFISVDWFLFGLFTPGIFFLARRWPLARGQLLAHGILHVLAALLFCALWAGLGTLLRVAVDPDSINSSLTQHFASWLFTTLPFGLAVYLATVGVEHAFRYFATVHEREAQMARLNEQLTSARLSALQAQLNPHFLFNSLNTVTVLVREGRNSAAASVVEHLSEVLRTTLTNTTAAEHDLGDEMGLVRQYLAVEQARFPDRLRPVFHVPDDLMSAAVPRFAVQHLVENAIRHGIAQRSDAGLIEITAQRIGDRLNITVRDDGPGVDSEMRMPPGRGVENTRERLRTLYGSDASLHLEGAAGGGTLATLVIPYGELLHDARES